MTAATLRPGFVLPDGGKKFSVFADTITIKIPSEITDSAYSVSEDVTPPGQGAPPHVHTRELETFVVLEGEYEFQCGGDKFEATKGAMVVLPKDIPHGFRVTGDTTGKSLVILVPGGMERVFEEISAMPPGPPDIEKVNAITTKYGVRFLPMG